MGFYDDDYGFRDYVSVGARRARAARELAKLRKNGRTISPVAIDGRTIAHTFWGKAWCDNLERYSDYANRLPRGRTYVRNGSVVDLQIAPGRVTALVSGSTMYEVQVSVGPVAPARWTAICKDCSGAIDSLVELLQGRLSKGVMTRLCEVNTGLFPSPKEIRFACSCPDWASMCKHVSAVLYGIGARLDRQPELLFTLRKVDQQELITTAGAGFSKRGRRPAGAKVLADSDLSEMFGIDIAPTTPPPRAASQRSSSAIADAPSGQLRATRPPKRSMPAPNPRPTTRQLTPAKRRAISERMRQYWAAWRNRKNKNASTSS